MEHIKRSLYTFVMLFLAVNSVFASVIPNKKFRCTLCEDKVVMRCKDVRCPLGSTTVVDSCGKCKTCGKTENEECGGVCNMFGSCSDGLLCHSALTEDKDSKVRFMAEKFTNAGRCMKPSDIPKSKLHKPDTADMLFSSAKDDAVYSEWISSNAESESNLHKSDTDYISLGSADEDSFMESTTEGGSGESDRSFSDGYLWSEGGTEELIMSSSDFLWSDGSSSSSKTSDDVIELYDTGSGNTEASGYDEWLSSYESDPTHISSVFPELR